jgi:hypothetical protein
MMQLSMHANLADQTIKLLDTCIYCLSFRRTKGDEHCECLQSAPRQRSVACRSGSAGGLSIVMLRLVLLTVFHTMKELKTANACHGCDSSQTH